MLTSLHLTNFQSHEDTNLEFTNGFNVIVGHSDSGKSGIIRALDYAVNNETQGIPDVSNWIQTSKGSIKANEVCDVTIKAGSNTISRIRTSERNGYTVNTKEYGAIGRDSVHEVTSLFNMGDVNWQFQHDAPFLLSYSAGDTAKFFNKITNLEAIDIALSNVKSKKSEITSEIKSKKTEIDELLSNKESLSWVADFKPKLDNAILLEANFNTVKEAYNAIQAIVKNAKDYKTLCEKADIVLNFENDLNKIIATRTTLQNTQNTQKAILSSVSGIRNYTNELRYCSAILLHEKNLQKIKKHLEHTEITNKTKVSLKDQIAKIHRVIDSLPAYDVEVCDKVCAKAQKAIEKHKVSQSVRVDLEKRIERIKGLDELIVFTNNRLEILLSKMPDTCPYCGSADVQKCR